MVFSKFTKIVALWGFIPGSASECLSHNRNLTATLHKLWRHKQSEIWKFNWLWWVSLLITTTVESTYTVSVWLEVKTTGNLIFMPLLQRTSQNVNITWNNIYFYLCTFVNLLKVVSSVKTFFEMSIFVLQLCSTCHSRYNYTGY